MRKYILLLSIAVVAAIQSLSAQNYFVENHNPKTGNKRWWLDIQAAQHIGLGKWSDVGYANDGFPAAAITEIRGVANLYISDPALGAFIDMGLGIMPAPAMRSFDLGRMPLPNSGTRYYLREMLSETGAEGASAHFKITAGLFGDFKATEKVNFIPYLGVGGLTMPRRSYRVILKEEGSNMQYNTTYTWGRNSESSGADMYGYLSARLNFRYRISAKSNLLFGLEYTYFFDAMNFYGIYSNTFNGNVQRKIMVEGNNMNMLGISVGLSFK